MFQIPESAEPSGVDRSDPLQSGRRCLLPGSVGLRLLGIAIMGLSMGPLVHAMGWWMDH